MSAPAPAPAPDPAQPPAPPRPSAVERIIRAHTAATALREALAGQPALLAHLEVLVTAARDGTESADPNARGPNGETALATACSNGAAGDVAALLEAGADPAAAGWLTDWHEVVDDGAFPPLYVAATKGHVEIARLLLAAAEVAGRDDGNAAVQDPGGATHGADVNQGTTDYGETPLYSACWGGNLEMVRLLLAHGADVNQATTDDGTTPLHSACDHGHLEMARLLLTHSADVNQARTDDGVTPLYIACDRGHLEVVRLLLAHGADINQATTHDGATPLYIACENGHLEIVRLLLAHGADVNQARTEDGATALFVACQERNLEVVRLLLAHGADVNQATTDIGTTPLHSTALEGHLEVARTLAVHGANLSALDLQGESAQGFARAFEHHHLADWLGAVTSWAPLRIAAACRLHTDAAAALRLGIVDPDTDTGPGGCALAAVRAAVATANAPPAQLPWPDATAVCQRTVRLVAAATRGWAPARHWLHHDGVRGAVRTTLLVAHRLAHGAFALTRPSQRAAHGAAGALSSSAPRRSARSRGGAPPPAAVMPMLPMAVLPPELWRVVMGFFLRQDWPAPSLPEV